MKTETEIWQVLTHEGVFQAELPTLKQWVVEGLVQPTDKVRKGALKWIEAGRVPGLRRVFSGEEQVAVEESAPDASVQPQTHAQAQTHAAEQPCAPQNGFAVGVVSFQTPVDAQTPAHVQMHAQTQAHSQTPGSQDLGLGRDRSLARGVSAAESSYAPAPYTEPVLSGEPSLSSACHFHPYEAATLLCKVCSTTFCRACPNRMGVSSVMICTLCGGFCDSLETVRTRVALYERQGSGFGFDDFRQALAYPFKHLVSLFGGALLYSFLLLAGLRGQLLAWGLVFGCISLIIRRVAYGRLDRDFLPDFSEFSFWDDVLVPCGLGLGVTIVTLGPTLLLLAALLSGWFGGAQTPKPLALAPPSARQEQQSDKSEDAVSLANEEEARQKEVSKKVQELSRQAQEASRVEKSKQSEDTAMSVVKQLLAHAGLVLLLGLAALAWAALYHPMALLVAGWTESFKSVVNPLVGIDTMRHMGLTYFKAFLMYVAVQVAGFFVMLLVSLATAPFDMPFIGNLPAKFLGGIVTFYTSLVIACILGLSLFKSADRLGIEIE
ncbi:MAG: hypothetical protein QOC99_3862 [Acidobacteriota bacterium]|nr:hypothetical protein [Acidobacteriota bacterium]